MFQYPELIKCQSCHHIESSQLICRANGFYTMTTLVFNELIKTGCGYIAAPLAYIINTQISKDTRPDLNHLQTIDLYQSSQQFQKSMKKSQMTTFIENKVLYHEYQSGYWKNNST